MVSVDPAGPHDHPSRNARALASGRLSLLLALEVALTGRATADRDRPPRVDPADEHREPALGSAPSLAWRPASLDHVLGDARLRDLKPELESSRGVSGAWLRR